MKKDNKIVMAVLGGMFALEAAIATPFVYNDLVGAKSIVHENDKRGNYSIRVYGDITVFSYGGASGSCNLVDRGSDGSLDTKRCITAAARSGIGGTIGFDYSITEHDKQRYKGLRVKADSLKRD